MANGVDPQRNHVRWIVTCITVLGLACAAGGTTLIYKGYAGDLLIGGALAAISGLAGFLGAGRPPTPQPDITLSAQPPKLEVNQRPPATT
jgi:hypothetical protein